MKRLVKFFMLLLAIAVTLGSCKKDDPTIPSDGEIEYSKELYVFSDTESENIISVDGDKVIFKQGSLPDDVKVGSIINSGINDNVPLGFLLRVLSVQNEDGQTVLHTEQAALTDAIINGDFSYSRDYTDDDILEIELYDGTIISQEQLKTMTKASLSSYLKLEYYEDGIIFSLKPEIRFTTHFDIKIKKADLEYLKTGIGMGLKTESTLGLSVNTKNLEAFKKLKQGKTIGTIKIKPFDVGIGKIRVGYRESVDMIVGVDINLSLALVTSIKTENSFDVSLVYNKGKGFAPQSNSTNKFTIRPFEASFKGTIEPFFAIYWRSQKFGLAENLVEIGPKVSFPIKGEINQEEATLSMLGQVSAHALEKFKFLGTTLIEFGHDWKLFELPLIDKKWTIKPVDEDGLTEDINNMLPPDMLKKFIDLGISINGGNTPPNIEGTYLVSPLTLVKSSVNSFFEPRPGTVYWNNNGVMDLSFSEQNSTNLAVKVDYSAGADDVGSGLGAFITGEGNKFSVFVEITGISGGYQTKSVQIHSGEITIDGIKNYQLAGVVTEAAPTTIKAGEGRLWKDGDGFSERVN